MTAGWVAATTRGRALSNRTLGADGARRLATAPGWSDARAELATTIYGVELGPDADRDTAKWTAVGAMTWQLRVLAGWLPPAAGGLARLAVGPMEIANIENHLLWLGGAGARRPIPLGSLGVAWPRVSTATSADEVRSMLRRSPWGDPGGTDRATIAFGMRIAWTRRLARTAPSVGEWAHGALAMMVARERFVFDREIGDVAGRAIDRMIDRRWREAATIPELRNRLPKTASWVLDDIVSAEELWRAELAILRRISADARRSNISGRYNRETVVAIMALLLVDLWWVTAAIEASGRGADGTEVFDAVA